MILPCNRCYHSHFTDDDTGTQFNLLNAAGFEPHCVTPELIALNHFPDVNEATSEQNGDLNKTERRNNYTLWGFGEKRARKASAEDHLNLFKHFNRQYQLLFWG